jgi:glycosyltransferase involved in cell wall biosynthesis
LIIVGQQGWMVEKLVERLRLHGQMNKRLFWFESISDEYLDKIYTTCTCLIAASYGEGFGLPLIEAAKYKLPIIARDIPVFREVAGEYAFYFCVDNALELMKVIKEWLMLYKKQRVPLSDKMPFLTWKQSANQLMEICIRKKDNYE